MRKTIPLTNIQEDQKVDKALLKQLSKAFQILQDIED